MSNTYNYNICYGVHYFLKKSVIFVWTTVPRAVTIFSKLYSVWKREGGTFSHLSKYECKFFKDSKAFFIVIIGIEFFFFDPLCVTVWKHNCSQMWSSAHHNTHFRFLLVPPCARKNLHVQYMATHASFQLSRWSVQHFTNS